MDAAVSAPVAISAGGRVWRFGPNIVGRDFVVGDLHGCFDQLRAAMAARGFDEARDRLFAVGDLIDRGPSSEEAVDWIARPWFHAVRGNHEQMAIDAAAGRCDLERHIQNGAGWFHKLPPARQKSIAAVFDTLPVAVEIDQPAGLVGVVHADVPTGDWTAFTEAVEHEGPSTTVRRSVFDLALWTRARFDARDTSVVTHVALVCVGHSSSPDPLFLGNVAFLDTGAGFRGGRLTMVPLDELLARVRPVGSPAVHEPPFPSTAAAAIP